MIAIPTPSSTTTPSTATIILPAPPRRRGGAGKMIVAVLGVVVLLGVGIAIINALSGSTTAGGYVNENYTPSAPDLNPPALPTVTTVAQATDTVTNDAIYTQTVPGLSLIHISEPTRLGMISYAVFCLKKKK